MRFLFQLLHALTGLTRFPGCLCRPPHLRTLVTVSSPRRSHPSDSPQEEHCWDGVGVGASSSTPPPPVRPDSSSTRTSAFRYPPPPPFHFFFSRPPWGGNPSLASKHPRLFHPGLPHRRAPGDPGAVPQPPLLAAFPQRRRGISQAMWIPRKKLPVSLHHRPLRVGGVGYLLKWSPLHLMRWGVHPTESVQRCDDLLCTFFFPLTSTFPLMFPCRVIACDGPALWHHGGVKSVLQPSAGAT